MTLSVIWGVKWNDIQDDILQSLKAMFIPILIACRGYASGSLDHFRHRAADDLLWPQDTQSLQLSCSRSFDLLSDVGHDRYILGNYEYGRSSTQSLTEYFSMSP